MSTAQAIFMFKVLSPLRIDLLRMNLCKTILRLAQRNRLQNFFQKLKIFK